MMWRSLPMAKCSEVWLAERFDYGMPTLVNSYAPVLIRVGAIIGVQSELLIV